MEEISRKKEVDEMKTLAKEFGFLHVAMAEGEYTLVANNSDMWRQITPASGQFVSETYFDLAGMTIDDETLFFDGAAIQEVMSPIAPGIAGNSVFVVDLMTTKPISDTTLQLYQSYGNMLGPGDLTFDQVIYGRIRFMNIDLDNAAGAVMITVSDNQTGSLEPTASDRIYCYRYVSFPQSNSDGDYFVTGARYLLRATAKEEPEYQYLMRLKRSYELQNEPDRD